MGDQDGPAAIVLAGDITIPVWVTDSGVKRLVLPPELASLPIERPPAVRVRIRGPVSEAGERHIGDVAQFIRALVAGRKPRSVPAADLSGLSAFTSLVLQNTCVIPWGEVRSYGWLAASIGMRGAARAVGGALGRNPVPLIVPCHRVVRSSGETGGFGAGVDVKEWLLARERCVPSD